MFARERALHRVVSGVSRVRCAHRLTRSLRTQAQYDYAPQEPTDNNPTYGTPAGLATPKQVRVAMLQVDAVTDVVRAARTIPRRVRGRARQCQEGPICRVRALKTVFWSSS